MERYIIGPLFMLVGVSNLLCAQLLAQDGRSVFMVSAWAALGVAWVVLGVIRLMGTRRRDRR